MRLVYFKEPTDMTDVSKMPHGVSGIGIQELDLSGAPEGTWRLLETAHGYHSITRTNSKRSPAGGQWLPEASLLKRCPGLLAICIPGAGYDIVDLDACTEKGIIVCNQSGAGREAVAEHAFGFMLALSKKIGLADRTIRRTADWHRPALAGNDLLGKTVGIVGFGQIGSRLGQLCRMLEMEILACDPYLSASQIAERGGAKVELDDLLARSDSVSLNGPLTKESQGMFGRAQFQRMKRNAFFITTARGGVHDESALVEALREGWIAGAGVDVFPVEPPLPDNPLFAFDNVLVTPHTAGITIETLRSLAKASADQWTLIATGKRPPRLLNPQAWPLYCDRFERQFGGRPSN